MIKACVDTLAALHNIFLFIFWGRQNAARPVWSHGYHSLTCMQRNTLFWKLLHVSKWTRSEVAFKKEMNRKSQDLPRIVQELPLLRELLGPSPSSMRPFLGPFPSPWGASPLNSCRCACLSSQERPSSFMTISSAGHKSQRFSILWNWMVSWSCRCQELKNRKTQ